VKRSIHLCRLLAVFLIASLVFAQLAARANVDSMASMAMTSMSGDHMADMSDDMPCCPDKSAPVDCDKCPLMASCMVKTFHAPSAGVIDILAVAILKLSPRSDPEAESLARPPPPRPPQQSPVGSA
jgi:hypothetical protein